MHAVKLIVGSIVAMIAVDVLLGLVDPHQLLPTELCVGIGVHGMTASVFLVPTLFIFVPPQRGSKRNLFVRAPLAVLVAWFAMIEFRMQFALPALRELARQREDYMYDGIGMNAAVLVMGWVPPLIVTIITVVLLQSVLAIRRLRFPRA